MGAVPVVHVPVHDQDALQPVDLLGVPGRNDDIVEDAETHRPVLDAVVPRGPDQGVGVADRAVHDRIHRGDGPAGRQAGDVKRIPPQVGDKSTCQGGKIIQRY